MKRSTIAAIATPSGRGGIGIIKISGTKARDVALALFKSSTNGRNSNVSWPSSHHLYHGWIMDPQRKSAIDEVLLTLMKGPKSYTGEDVLEIQAHSGSAVMNQILSLVFNEGVRPAEPGEFTKRAFLNGRIDLSQAESVMETISAQSDQALHMAMAQMTGGMRKTIKGIRDELANCLVLIETAIDFIEDEDDLIITDSLPQHLQLKVVDPLKKLIDLYRETHLFREGLKMAVIGKPNVGKSSLLNSLMGQERAIVTDITGTTRDLIEASLTSKGMPVIAVDTAGFRQDGDAIERIGIQKTKNFMSEANLILFLMDARNAPDKNDIEIYNQIAHKNVIIVLNKMDLVRKKIDFSLPDKWKQMPSVRISALEHTGIDALKAAILRSVHQNSNNIEESPIIPNLRQKVAIEKTMVAAKRLIKGLELEAPLEMTAIDAREALDHMGYITGETLESDIIDDIFNRFCIGK